MNAFETTGTIGSSHAPIAFLLNYPNYRTCRDIVKGPQRGEVRHQGPDGSANLIVARLPVTSDDITCVDQPVIFEEGSRLSPGFAGREIATQRHRRGLLIPHRFQRLPDAVRQHVDRRTCL
jgi:hypothetical protein